MANSQDVKNPPFIKREFSCLLLVVGAIFLALSLATYTPKDPSLTAYPLGPSENLMGPVGASMADFLISLFGLVAWAFPLALLLSAFGLFEASRAFIPSNLHLWAGLVLFMVGAATGLAFFNDTFLGEAPGGLLGRYLKDFFLTWIGVGGVVLLSTFSMISGIMIGTTLEFEHLISLFTRREEEELSIKKDRIKSKKGRPRGKKTEMDERDEQVGDQTLPRIADPKWASSKANREQQGGDTDHKSEHFPVTQAVEGSFVLPHLDLLKDPPDVEMELDEEQFYENARVLEQKLLDFGVKGKVVEICPGPVVTMYEFSPAPGVKINKVASLQDDIALALKSHSVRIVAPIPGKSVIGIELANQKRHIVYLKEILSSDIFREKRWVLPLALGKDVIGEPVVTDLAKMPHLLIAGATGTGKSVGLNAMICSLLFRHLPTDLRLLMIDPKRIELSLYDGIPHLLHPVVSNPKEATQALRWAVQEMERRYELLESTGSRNINTYNKKIRKEDAVENGEEEERRELPYLVIIIDELADLMMVSSKEVEGAIARLAQMARAAGIHLIVATQRPSVDVLTGLIKANFPARLSFKVSSKVDSRTILDTGGAERLLGLGDMLFLPPGSSNLERIHGAYCSEEEIKAVTDFWRGQGSPNYDLSVTEPQDQEEDDSDQVGGKGDFKDALYDQAIDIVTQSGQASISMIQRRLRVGYNRAARMIEQMERDGIVSPADSMGRRQVLVKGYSDI